MYARDAHPTLRALRFASAARQVNALQRGSPRSLTRDELLATLQQRTCPTSRCASRSMMSADARAGFCLSLGSFHNDHKQQRGRWREVDARWASGVSGFEAAPPLLPARHADPRRL